MFEFECILEDKLVATSGRGPGFDQIRLAAAGTVLLHHCRLTQYDIRDPLFLYSGGFIHFGLLAVIVFFAISGFLVVPSLVQARDTIGFLVNRAVRIFPALFIVVFATAVCLGPNLSTLPYHDYFAQTGPYLYFKNTLTLTYNYLPGIVTGGGEPVVVNGALWTLHFEVLAYAALAILGISGVLHNRAVFLILFLGCYAGYVLMSFAPSLANYLPGRFTIFLSLFVYFAAGSALFVFRDYVPYSGRLALAALGVVLIALPVGLGPVFLPLSLPYLTTFSGLSVLPGQRLVKRDLSYGVYLIHAPVIVAATFIFPSPASWLLLALIVSLATVCLSYLCRILVEEPALRRKKAVARWIKSKLAIA